VLAVALGAVGADAVALINCLSVARAFAEQIGATELDYDAEVAALARASVASVIDDDTAEAAITGIASFVANELAGL